MVEILLVEDNEFIRTATADLIGLQDDLSVAAQAQDGAIALALLKNGLRIDVVVTDINMPEMDGIELTECVVAMDKGIKVIILTMHDNKAFFDRAFAAGAHGYLLKNGNMDELFLAIDKVYKGAIAVIGQDLSFRQ